MTPTTCSPEPCRCSDYAIPAPVNKFTLEDSTFLGYDVVPLGGKQFKFIFRGSDTTLKAVNLNFVHPSFFFHSKQRQQSFGNRTAP